MKKTKRNSTYKGRSTKRVKKMRFAFYLTVFIIFLIGLNLYQKEYLNAATGQLNALNTNLNTEIQKNQDLNNRLNEMIEYEELSVEEKIRKIAKENNFRWTDYLVRLAYCESRFDPKALGDSGKSRGLFQIHSGYHPDVSDEQAYNIRFATEFAIKAINEGHQEWWTCDKIVKNL